MHKQYARPAKFVRSHRIGDTQSHTDLQSLVGPLQPSLSYPIPSRHSVTVCGEVGISPSRVGGHAWYQPVGCRVSVDALTGQVALFVTVLLGWLIRRQFHFPLSLSFPKHSSLLHNHPIPRLLTMSSAIPASTFSVVHPGSRSSDTALDTAYNTDDTSHNAQGQRERQRPPFKTHIARETFLSNGYERPRWRVSRNYRHRCF
jgi:hypothetical protein